MWGQSRGLVWIHFFTFLFFQNTHGGIRTHNLWIRSPTRQSIAPRGPVIFTKKISNTRRGKITTHRTQNTRTHCIESSFFYTETRRRKEISQFACFRGAIGQRVRLLIERLVVQAHPGAKFFSTFQHLKKWGKQVPFLCGKGGITLATTIRPFLVHFSSS